jgi:sulfite reductase beta subunit-like hemoprotein
MSTDNSTPVSRESINERIRASVRQNLQPRTISIDVTTEFLTLCARWGTTPEDLIKGFITDITLDDSAPYDPYAALYHQAARNYLYVAHGCTRIIKRGKYTERPLPRTFN